MTRLTAPIFTRTLLGMLFIPFVGIQVACAPRDEDVFSAERSFLTEEELQESRNYAPFPVDPDRPSFTFERACDAGESLTVAAVGDVLLHGSLQRQGFKSLIGFRSLWEGVEHLLQQADVTYANLEGPTATGVKQSGSLVPDSHRGFDGVVYTSYPQFNYHPDLLSDLKTSGVDIVSTANNHSLDRRSIGIDRTLESLEAVGLSYSGTRRKGDHVSPWQATIDREGFKTAWIACTFSTNGIIDKFDQVLDCYRNESFINDLIRSLSESKDVDAVIVTPHWGDVEYTSVPAAKEKALARRFLDSGAIAILGSHPHVLQPWEKYTTKDGRETFVIYSLGNFVSGQKQLARRSTVVLYLGLSKEKSPPAGQKAETWINGVRFVPAVMHYGSGGMSLQPADEDGVEPGSRAHTLSLFPEQNALDSRSPLPANLGCPGR